MEAATYADVNAAVAETADAGRTIEAYRLMSERADYPLHLGITEAGLLRQGTIRSSVGIGALLAMGIGDTLRVSLTADPVEEIRVGIEILKSLDLRQRGYTLISCPTCARCGIDLIAVVTEVERRLDEMKDLAPITVAVMGCEVNGPGEAREADVGVAGSKDGGVIFSGGQAIRKVSAADMVNELIAEVRRVADRTIL